MLCCPNLFDFLDLLLLLPSKSSFSFYLVSGEFVVVNKHLLHDLTEMGLWSPTLKNKIIYENGSVQKMSEIPEDLKVIYRYMYLSFVSCLPFYPHFLLHFIPRQFIQSGLFGRSSKRHWLTWLWTVDAT